MTNTTGPANISLDDLYAMTAHMYSHRNEDRAVSATFSHFIEVCAALTASARQKQRDGLDTAGALCKALGWFFPLMAKLGVRSVEDLIYRKYPNCCPYCRKNPHVEIECKLVKGTAATVDHEALRLRYTEEASNRPRSLDEWQSMFAKIYPRSLNDVTNGRSAIGLFEELGELGEAVRVFDHYPKYLAGEAADVFSYLMALATEYGMQEDFAGRPGFSLESEFFRRYPGLCTQCGYHVCVCPPIPSSTVGRLAKELDLADAEALFERNRQDAASTAAKVADRVIGVLGGYHGLLAVDSTFPFDRGDANRSLILSCLRAAEVLQAEDPAAAASLRSTAFRIGAQDAPAGSSNELGALTAALSILRSNATAIAALESGPAMKFDESAGGRIAPPEWRILLVLAGPSDEDALDLGREIRDIQEAVRRAKYRDGIFLQICPATRVSDLRRALLETDFDLLYMSGHGDRDGPLLEDEMGNSAPLTVEQLRELTNLATTLRCVVLNTCYSAVAVVEPLAPITICMYDVVDDDAAILFGQGFFDGLGAGRDLERSVEEGRVAARLILDDARLPVVTLTVP